MIPALAAQIRSPSDDRLRAVIDSVFAASRYRWREPVDPFAPLRRGWRWLLEFFGSLRTESPSLYWVLIGIMVLVLAAIFAHALWVMYRTMRGDTAAEIGTTQARSELRNAAWYAREAARLASAGRYAEAIQTDFIRLLLELDARRLVRFHPSRTPNEYAREPSLSPAARSELADLVRRLYAYAFARAECGSSELRDWQERAAVERYARV